jgi:molybdate transport system regulatory protein
LTEDLTAVVTVQRGALPRVALGRMALVEAIGELGSISAAARRVGLSYKGAWDAVQALNNLFDSPLIDAAPGGKAGGAARVTARGQAVLVAFRRVQVEMDAALAKLDHTLSGAPAADLFWSLGMKTSARNALRGVISDISPGAVSAEVTLNLSHGVSVTAMLTRQSIEDLDLTVGKAGHRPDQGELRDPGQGREPAHLGPQPDPRDHHPPRGRRGEQRDHPRTSAAARPWSPPVTLESAQALQLAAGDAVTALVKAPHVILAVE